MRLQEKMYYAVPWTLLSSVLTKGAPLQELNTKGDVGVLLFYFVQDAIGYCQDCFGMDEDSALVCEVDMSGITLDMLNDFTHIRSDDYYIVFGEHTFLTVAIERQRMKIYR